MGASSSPLLESSPLPPNPQRQVIGEGRFDWGWFRAYSDGSIEVETNGENRLYRNFAELEWERKLKRRSDEPTK